MRLASGAAVAALKLLRNPNNNNNNKEEEQVNKETQIDILLDKTDRGR